MVRAIVLVAGVTFAFAEAIRGSIRVCGLDADVVDGLGCVALGHRDPLLSGKLNAQADTPGADPSSGQQPLPRFRGLPAEVLNVSASCSSLDLHSCKRLARDDRNALGFGRVVVQDPLEPADRLLGLDQHLTHVDQGEVLVRTALELAMSDVARLFERVDVRLGEEPAYDDCHQVECRGGGYREAWGHFSLILSERYQSVAPTPPITGSQKRGEISSRMGHLVVSLRCFTAKSIHADIGDPDFAPRPAGKQIEVPGLIFTRQITGSVQAFQRMAIRRHSPLLHDYNSDQARCLILIYSNRTYKSLVPPGSTAVGCWQELTIADTQDRIETMARAGRTSTKIKRQSKTPAQLMADAVATKGEAIGAPAIQVARGLRAIVDVPLRDAGRVLTEHTLINRGGTPVARWKAAKLLSDSHVAAIDHCETLWSRLGGKALVMDLARIPGAGQGNGWAEQEALDDLKRIKGYVPPKYWNLFENVCRFDMAAGFAGSDLTACRIDQVSAARKTVQFGADIIAMKEQLF